MDDGHPEESAEVTIVRENGVVWVQSGKSLSMMPEALWDKISDENDAPMPERPIRIPFRPLRGK